MSWRRSLPCASNEPFFVNKWGNKGTDLFIDDRQAVSSRIPLTADDPATAPLALPTVRQNEQRRYAAWIEETIVAGDWELIQLSLQWG